MLRPALLLPPKRLSTPRCGLRDLSRRLGPATRRSGAYRGGTLTRWLAAASSTRHGRIVRRAYVPVMGRALEVPTAAPLIPPHPTLPLLREAAASCRACDLYK